MRTTTRVPLAIASGGDMSPKGDPSVGWDECGCILKQLQAAAHCVHDELGRTTSKSSDSETVTPERSSNSCRTAGSKRQLRALLTDILSCLQEFRAAVNAAFLSDTEQHPVGNNSTQSMPRVQTKRVADLLSKVQAVTQCLVPTVVDIRTARADGIAQELAAVAQLDQVLDSLDLPPTSSANKQRLQLLIQRLRQQEQQLGFHRGLLRSQREFAGADGKYSEENFAYGSTPFPTWLHFFTQPAVCRVIAQDPRHVGLTVFGSSTGSLALFAALVLGIQCTGVELLPFLHDTAEQNRDELHISADNCRFVCADMLSAQLESTSILLLTSQCWDTELYAQVQRKLELELRPGTLVLDYKPTLQRSSSFRVVQRVEQQRVSWSSSQSLYILERLRC